MKEPGPDEHMRQRGGFQRLMASTTFESPFAKKSKVAGIGYSPLELDEVRCACHPVPTWGISMCVCVVGCCGTACYWFYLWSFSFASPLLFFDSLVVRSVSGRGTPICLPSPPMRATCNA